MLLPSPNGTVRRFALPCSGPWKSSSSASRRPRWRGRVVARTLARMARPSCIYCGAADGDQAEHVFPSSWYPNTTPKTCQRLTVPSCPACNARFKAAEERFIEPVMMSLVDCDDARGLYERLSRGWKPDGGKSERDQAHRGAKFVAMLGRVKFGKPPDANANDPIAAFLSTPRDDLVAAAPGSPLQHADIDVIGEKFVRGLFFGETGRRLGLSQFTARVVNDELFAVGGPDTKPLVEALRARPVSDRLAPGLRYRVATSPMGDQVWLFTMWGQLDVFTIVVPKEARPSGR